MANTFREKGFLIPIMCSYLSQSAAYFMHSGFLLHIISNYAFQTLCGSPHNVWNEEGKLNGLPLNRALRDEDNDIYDIVAGTFLVVGLGESEFASLTPALMEKYEKLFHSPEAFLNLNGHLTVIPMPEPQARKSTKERGEAR